MGLDTTHDCFHGPYSAFHRWRCQIAAMAYPELENEKDPARAFFARFNGESEDRLEAMARGEWEPRPTDALHVLLMHSDCDGEIPHYWTKRIADRLTELLPKLSDDWYAVRGLGARRATETFIAGLLDAHAKGDAVEFH